MKTCAGYIGEKLLGRSRCSEVWLALREDDRERVVLKQCDPTQAAFAEAERDALERMDGRGVPRVLAFERAADPPILVIEYVPGPALSSVAPVSPAEFIELALGLAETLAQMHEYHLLHNDLKPSHVIIDPKRDRPVLIDLGAVTPFGGIAGRTAWTPLYGSPEQTGRTNLGIDCRSDLYGLGGVLYFALTGVPPFDQEDKRALIHSHLARLPTAPLDVVEDAPPTLSRIVMKLLAKDPADRYQSAAALAVDLRECRSQLERFGAIDDNFVLGTADAPTRPLFPRRLHGRDDQVRRLRDAFARARRGATEIVLVHGPAGFGKSALVDGLQADIVASGAHLVRGKCEEARVDHPYFAMFRALEALVHQVLAEGEEQIAIWARELREGLGNLARVVVDVLPDLAAIVGEVPDVPSLGPEQARERLVLAVDRLMDVFAREEHPLVLVLDDLQWADPASLFLIDRLRRSTESDRALLVLGTARDHDEADRSRFESLCAELEPEAIEVGPLTHAGTSEMLADALGKDVESVGALAGHILRKTSGSPFLVQQLVYLAHDRGLIRHRHPSGWVWDEAGIAATEASDDAVEMMLDKIEGLDPRARFALELAGCVGARFDTRLLAALAGRSEGELEGELYLLSNTGLIAPRAGYFHFVHDRIREAARRLCSEEQQARIRLEVARQLVAQVPAEELDVLEVADHIRAALPLCEPEDRAPFLGVLQRAGRKAAGDAAHAAAHAYLRAAHSLFVESDWTERRAAAMELFVQSVDTAVYVGDFEEAERALGALEQRVELPLERANVACRRVALTLRSKGSEAASDVAIDAVRSLGMRCPRHPSALRAYWTTWSIDWRLALRRGRELFEPLHTPPPPEKLAQLWVLVEAAPSLVEARPRVARLTAALATRIYLKYGYVRSPSFLLAGLAAYAATLRRYAAVKRYATWALEWAEKAPDPELGLRARYNALVLFAGLLQPKRVALAEIPRLRQDARELGSAEYVGFTYFHELVLSALLGATPARLRALIEAAPPEMSASLAALADVIDLLEAPSDEKEVLADEIVAKQYSGSGGSSAFRVWTFVCLVMSARGLSRAASLVADRMGEGELYRPPEAYAARAIALAGEVQREGRRISWRERWTLRRLERHLAQMERFGTDAPYALDIVRGERLCLSGQTKSGLALLERAARRAADDSVFLFAALAHHRRGLYLAGARRGTESEAAFEAAARAYAQCGATGAAEDLRARMRPPGS